MLENHVGVASRERFDQTGSAATACCFSRWFSYFYLCFFAAALRICGGCGERLGVAAIFDCLVAQFTELESFRKLETFLVSVAMPILTSFFLSYGHHYVSLDFILLDGLFALSVKYLGIFYCFFKTLRLWKTPLSGIFLATQLSTKTK